MKYCGIGKEAVMHYKIHLMGDIGIFGEHSESLAREFLTEIPASADQEKVNQLIRSLNGTYDSDFQVIQGAIPQVSLKKLREFADNKYSAAVKRGVPTIEIEDLKIYLSPDELKELIGNDSFNYHQKTFRTRCDEIVVRRCQAHELPH
jgi:hypothetical protein